MSEYQLNRMLSDVFETEISLENLSLKVTASFFCFQFYILEDNMKEKRGIGASLKGKIMKLVCINVKADMPIFTNGFHNSWKISRTLSVVAYYIEEGILLLHICTTSSW